MRRKLALLTGAILGALAALWLRARRRAPSPTVPPEPDPRAEDLRRRLAEARDAAPSVAPPSAGAASGAPADAPRQEEFEAMRRRVHEEARAAAEKMRRRSEGGDG